MSSAEDTATEETEEQQPEPDERRQALLDRLAEGLGDDLVESHLVAHDDLWIRVRTEAWDRSAVVCQAAGLTYFCFLSAIDWMPSPYGRSERGLEGDELPTGDTAGDELPTGDTAGDELPSGDTEGDELPTGDTAGDEPTGDTAGDEPATDPTAPSAETRSGVTGGDTRFQLLARVYDTTTKLGITLKTDVPDSMTMATWTGTYSGADWHERETWEMFGIEFAGHPHLQHIYLPSEFEGFPLRKDFPLLSREVKPWPGIVDVEPMPGEDDDAGENAAAEEGESS